MVDTYARRGPDARGHAMTRQECAVDELTPNSSRGADHDYIQGLLSIG